MKPGQRTRRERSGSGSRRGRRRAAQREGTSSDSAGIFGFRVLAGGSRDARGQRREDEKAGGGGIVDRGREEADKQIRDSSSIFRRVSPSLALSCFCPSRRNDVKQPIREAARGRSPPRERSALHHPGHPSRHSSSLAFTCLHLLSPACTCLHLPAPASTSFHCASPGRPFRSRAQHLLVTLFSHAHASPGRGKIRSLLPLR